MGHNEIPGPKLVNIPEGPRPGNGEGGEYKPGYEPGYEGGGAASGQGPARTGEIGGAVELGGDSHNAGAGGEKERPDGQEKGQKPIVGVEEAFEKTYNAKIVGKGGRDAGAQELQNSVLEKTGV